MTMTYPPPLNLERLELGQPVRFTHALERRREYVVPQGPRGRWNEHHPGYDRKWWEAVPRDPAHDLCAGIITGRRTLADGEVHGWEHSTFTPTRHFRVWLVVGALDLSPWFVLPEHLEPPRVTVTRAQLGLPPDEPLEGLG